MPAQVSGASGARDCTAASVRGCGCPGVAVVQTKVCNSCHVEKPLPEFNKNAAAPDGLYQYCKPCFRAYRMGRRDRAREENPTPRQARKKLNQQLATEGKRQCSKCEEIKEASDFYSEASNKDGLASHCKACVADYSEKTRLGDMERARVRSRDYYARTKEIRGPRIRETQRSYLDKRRKTDANYKCYHSLSNRIRRLIKLTGSQKEEHTVALVGCSMQELCEHLERQFTDGMAWDNHGFFWHIGHKTPCAAFDLTSLEQQKECFHYTNLFPQRAPENLSLGATHAGVNFRMLKASDYSVIRIPLSDAKALVAQYHYAGSAPSAATVCYGLTRKDAPEALLGATIWRPAPLGAALKECPEDPQAVLCLSRLVLVPDLPKNAAYLLLSTVSSAPQSREVLGRGAQLRRQVARACGNYLQGIELGVSRANASAARLDSGREVCRQTPGQEVLAE